jgi:hypothetical protein
MVTYSIDDTVNLRCYPNYSFEVGDVDGDGRDEVVFPRQDGRLMVIRQDGG